MPDTIENSQIIEYFKGAKIFLTGGTGFIGKVLIEKFIRVFDIEHIYVLIRIKKGKDPQARFKELFDEPVFDTIRKKHPDYEKKVTCIVGDISSVRLGMSDSDYELIIKEATHIFHAAANVKFNEKLISALKINVNGTQEAVALCNQCLNVKMFVHVSTAYAHCIELDIEEKYYTPPLTKDQIFKLVSTLSDEKLEAITPELIKPWPNTYAYTKSIAENIVLDVAKHIPHVIFRPAIIMGAAKDPIKGWIDNIYGANGVLAAAGIGFLKVIFANDDSLANVVPVDLTVNALLASTWEAGTSFKRNAAIENTSNGLKESISSDRGTEIVPKVYNFVADSENPITWRDFRNLSLEFGVEVPSEKSIWYYTMTLTTLKPYYWFLVVILHYVPALITDFVFVCLGKKPNMWKAYQKIHTFSDVTKIFATTNWRFHNKNSRKLWKLLSDRDKELFDFDMLNLNWKSYFQVVVRGMRLYIFREKDDTLPAAKRRMYFLFILHRLTQIGFIVFCFWILTKIIFTFDGTKPNLQDSVVMPELLKNST